NQRGMARNIFAHVLGENPRVEIVSTARAATDDRGNVSPLVKRFRALREPGQRTGCERTRHNSRHPPATKHSHILVSPPRFRPCDTCTKSSSGENSCRVRPCSNE